MLWISLLVVVVTFVSAVPGSWFLVDSVATLFTTVEPDVDSSVKTVNHVVAFTLPRLVVVSTLTLPLFDAGTVIVVISGIDVRVVMFCLSISVVNVTPVLSVPDLFVVVDPFIPVSFGVILPIGDRGITSVRLWFADSVVTSALAPSVDSISLVVGSVAILVVTLLVDDGT
uniref:Secreted protein n=1 Tax=Ixodes ricinus TaxID=34613 RepID=A0A147BT18_IXORI